MFQSTSPNLVGIDAKTAALSKMMPDKLKQYAMLHQDDIITMSLISSIQKKRNEEKLAQQAQQANAVPPKVNEQLINSIQQEESGIASLPAQNMVMAADGGIVGYSGNGEQGQLVRGRDEETTFPEGSLLGMWEKYQKQNPNLPLAALFSNAPEYKAMREESQRQKLSGGPTGSAFTPGSQSGLRPEESPSPAPPSAKSEPRKGGQSRPQSAPAGTARPKAPTQAPAQVPDQAPAAPAKSIEDYFKEASVAAGVGKAVDPNAAKRDENAALLKAQGEEELADSKARQAGLMSLMKPREERIAKREAALEAQGETDKAMAIIHAGLSMMQSTGKGGIAAGATEGMKQYAASTALSKAERQKINDARDAFDEFKFNADSMSQKEITANKRKIIEGTVAASEKGIAAIEAREGVSRAEAQALFKARVDEDVKAKQDAAHLQRTREEIKGRETTARIGADAMRDRAGGAGGAPKQRLAELKSLQTNLVAQLKETMPYGPTKKTHEAITAKLAEINKEIELMAGIGTMPPSPGATAPAQNRPPLGAFQK